MRLDYLTLKAMVLEGLIDNYDGHLLIQWYSKGIYKFRYNVIEAIQQVFPFKSIYEKCVLKTLNTPVDM